MAINIAIAENMADIKHKVEFEPVPMKIGAGWFVRVMLPRGEQPRLGGFNSEAEAREWIKRKSAAWLREHHGYQYL
jgi:hypothetical protein